MYIYIYNVILYIKWNSTHHKQEGNPATCNNMVGPWGHYDKLNKIEKDKYSMIALICGIFKKKYIDIEDRLVIARGRVGGHGGQRGMRGGWNG